MTASMPARLVPLMSSDDTTWNTPRNLLDLVRAFGPIGLDPCGNAGSIVGATKEYRFVDRGEDGLKLPWNDRGLVYVNPPYGRELAPWAERMAAWANVGVEIIALVPARTDTRWWTTLVGETPAVCFWRGRLKFGDAKNSAPFPSAVFYFGHQGSRFRFVFRTKGWCP